MKPPLTYYGGKQQLAKRIVSLIPEHRLYCEPFFGGGAVFFGKSAVPVEIINDINGELMNFYRVLKTDFAQLDREIKATMRSRKLYRHANVVYQNPDLFDPVKRAWAIWVLADQCYSSIFGNTWGYDSHGNTSSTRTARKRRNFSVAYADRLDRVQVECSDAIELIKSKDSEQTFFYLDPPYFNSNKGHYGNYSEDDFERLLRVLTTIKGKFLLSSYHSVLLDRYVRENNWHVLHFDMPVSVTARFHKRKRKTEVLVGNYELS